VTGYDCLMTKDKCVSCLYQSGRWPTALLAYRPRLISCCRLRAALPLIAGEMASTGHGGARFTVASNPRNIRLEDDPEFS
jgi:hypothetical protein